MKYRTNVVSPVVPRKGDVDRNRIYRITKPMNGVVPRKGDVDRNRQRSG